MDQCIYVCVCCSDSTASAPVTRGEYDDGTKLCLSSFHILPLCTHHCVCFCSYVFIAFIGAYTLFQDLKTKNKTKAFYSRLMKTS